MSVRLPALLFVAAIAGIGGGCSDSSHRSRDPGLIVNPAFADAAGGNAIGSPWAAVQHGGESSYLFGARNGVLRIERVGTQPYGQVVQVLPAEKLRGKTVEFSADLSGELESINNPSVPWADHTGLSIIVKGYSTNPRMRMLGKRVLLESRSEPGLAPGSHDWTHCRVVVKVPEQATEIEVGIRLVLNGVLKARSPALVMLQT